LELSIKAKLALFHQRISRICDVYRPNYDIRNGTSDHFTGGRSTALPASSQVLLITPPAGLRVTKQRRALLQSSTPRVGQGEAMRKRVAWIQSNLTDRVDPALPRDPVPGRLERSDFGLTRELGHKLPADD